MTKELSDMVNKAKRTRGAIIILDPPMLAHLLTIPGMGDRLALIAATAVGTLHMLDKDIPVITGTFKRAVTKGAKARDLYLSIVEEHRAHDPLPDGTIPSPISIEARKLYCKLHRLVKGCPVIAADEWTGGDRDAFLVNRLIERAWIGHWMGAKL